MELAGQLTQYFKIVVSSPPESKGKKVSLDVTKYVNSEVTFEDEDGLIQQLTFDLKQDDAQSSLLVDIFTVGMRVDLVGGSLTESQVLFLGFIKVLTPSFTEEGVVLNITAHAEEGKKLGTQIKNLVYPAKNHPMPWAKKDVSYAAIITNLAEEAGYKKGDIRVLKGATATLAKPIKQHNDSDYSFMQYLAKKINCTIWISIEENTGYINLVDNSLLVNKIADYTFFYPLRKNATEFTETAFLSPKKIQLDTVNVQEDSSSGSAGTFKQITDPKTGAAKIVIENKNAKGDDTQNGDATGGRWVLDDSTLPADDAEQRRIIDLFMSGRVTWEGTNGSLAAKNYFKFEPYAASSREAERTNTEVETLKGDIKGNGLSSTLGTTSKTEAKQYKTVIDTDKLGQLSSEEKTAVMGRIVRGEMTEKDKSYYKSVDVTPATVKDEATTAPTQALSEKGKAKKSKKTAEPKDPDRKKRDEGFRIEATCPGNLIIKTKLSYVIEGIAKHSNTYYLYRTRHIWGSLGYRMDLTFVK